MNRYTVWTSFVVCSLVGGGLARAQGPDQGTAPGTLPLLTLPAPSIVAPTPGPVAASPAQSEAKALTPFLIGDVGGIGSQFAVNESAQPADRAFVTSSPWTVPFTCHTGLWCQVDYLRWRTSSR